MPTACPCVQQQMPGRDLLALPSSRVTIFGRKEKLRCNTYFAGEIRVGCTENLQMKVSVIVIESQRGTHLHTWVVHAVTLSRSRQAVDSCRAWVWTHRKNARQSGPNTHLAYVMRLSAMMPLCRRSAACLLCFLIVARCSNASVRLLSSASSSSLLYFVQM